MLNKFGAERKTVYTPHVGLGTGDKIVRHLSEYLHSRAQKGASELDVAAGQVFKDEDKQTYVFDPERFSQYLVTRGIRLQDTREVNIKLMELGAVVRGVYSEIDISSLEPPIGIQETYIDYHLEEKQNEPY
jgi:translation initiation factor 2B subunit (eIF-2B alpha/beta/delta family)